MGVRRTDRFFRRQKRSLRVSGFRVNVSAVTRRERGRSARRAPARRSCDDFSGVHGRHRRRGLRRLGAARARAVFGAPAAGYRRLTRKKRAVLVRARRARAGRRGDVESRDDVRFRRRKRREYENRAREAGDGDHERGNGVGGGHAHGKREGSFARARRRRRRRDVARRRARHGDYRRRRARLGDEHVRESAGGVSGHERRAEMRHGGAVRRARRAREGRRDGARRRLRVALLREE